MVLGVLAIVGHLMPRKDGGGQGRGGFLYGVPPAWSPEHEASYSFRAWCQVISLWVMLTDLGPHKQVAAIGRRLGGAAPELVRGIRPQELAAGGAINGVQYDPVSYIVVGLQQRFAQLDDESRLVAMTQLLAFQRRRGAGINGVLLRCDVARQRAACEGNFIMSWEAYALLLLRACDVSPN